MYWKGFEPTKLLDDSRLVACIHDLPFQEGMPLSPTGEEGTGDTKLADYSNTYKSSPDCHIYIESLQDLGDDADRYADELDNQISVDELSTNAP